MGNSIEEFKKEFIQLYGEDTLKYEHGKWDAYLAGRIRNKELDFDREVNFELDYCTKLDSLSIEELRKTIVLMHSWVKGHQAAVNSANRLKNAYKDALDLEQSTVDFYANPENWDWVNNNRRTLMKKDNYHNENMTAMISGKLAIETQTKRKKFYD